MIVNREGTAPHPWHADEAEEALLKLASSAEGLAQKDVQNRLQEYGPNRLSPAKKKSALARFLTQFHNLLIYVLLGAGAITALLGHWVDSGVIVGVVVINAIISFIQEGKAKKALDAIRTCNDPFLGRPDENEVFINSVK